MALYKSLIALILIGFLASCQENLKEESESTVESKTEAIEFELKVGDILFQDSDCGPFCESIEKVTFGVDGCKFSHVAMVIPDEKGGLIAIEAISAGVVETSLDDFFQRSFDADNNSKVVVGRMKKEHAELIPGAIAYAKTKLGASYDEAFDITNDKYYCSELIYESFAFANDSTPIFELQPMTYNDPATDSIFPIWADYFNELGIPVPEGEPGLNPGGMSMSPYIEIVHFYGRPEGYESHLN